MAVDTDPSVRNLTVDTLTAVAAYLDAYQIPAMGRLAFNMIDDRSDRQGRLILGLVKRIKCMEPSDTRADLIAQIFAKNDAALATPRFCIDWQGDSSALGTVVW